MTPLLRALANPHRLEILCALSAGEVSVGALQALAPLSQHLARLRVQQMVATRRQAQTIYYRIAEAEVLLMAQALLRRASRSPPTAG